MGLFGFIKDVVLLPIDIAQDITGIGMIKRAVKDELNLDDSGLDTIERIKNMGKNWDDTYDKE